MKRMQQLPVITRAELQKSTKYIKIPSKQDIMNSNPDSLQELAKNIRALLSLKLKQ